MDDVETDGIDVSTSAEPPVDTNNQQQEKSASSVTTPDTIGPRSFYSKTKSRNKHKPL